MTIVGAICMALVATSVLLVARNKARFFVVASSVWYEGHANYVFIYDTETMDTVRAA
jgi:hypothetical protein